MKCATPATPPSTGLSGTLYFQITENEINDPKRTRKYHLHYDDVQEDVWRPSHGTTPALVKINKVNLYVVMEKVKS